jgi:hypothetical protein
MTYKIQIDNEVRDATPEEAALIEARRDEALAEKTAIDAAKQSAFKKLAALGLTDAEIAALVR